MKFSEHLCIRRGLTALIGGGGKTALMERLADELCGSGTVVLCTSTHIRRPQKYKTLTGADPAQLHAALAEYGVVCIGTPAENGKLAAPALSFETLASLADYVIVEADGAHGLPLKAHLPSEPVIPANAEQTILVLGADGFGQPISEVCHRPALWADLAQARPGDPVTPQYAARVILQECGVDRVLINKAETPKTIAAAKALAALLPYPVVIGSLWKEEILCWS